eukprot:Blabericola_migrator_1__3136@NODE_1917_length_3565_cov_161_453116_g1225_i0_p2_GENE_NODE_1917_length_3565_cov_161_453116_g1225_i0NODE_1917_length_3565_cov_161_453116_g1225_i0_p2_ORF_typecomplete_len334_score61_57_NODE_1917_length_3565_cov_161_453116_g1225_i05351536
MHHHGDPSLQLGGYRPPFAARPMRPMMAMGPPMAPQAPPHLMAMPPMMRPMYGPMYGPGYGAPRPDLTPSRQGSPEETTAFYRKLKTLPPTLLHTLHTPHTPDPVESVRLSINVQSAPLDKLALSRFLFAIMRRKRCQIGRQNVVKSLLVSRQPTSSAALNALVPIGLRHTAAVHQEVLQHEAAAHNEELTRCLRPLSWYTLSPFHPTKAFYNFDRSLGVESYPLSTLLASGDDDYGDTGASDPFVRDSGLTYVSRVLQRAAMDFGPGYTLRPRLREVAPDVLDMVSILSLCMKTACQDLAAKAIACAAAEGGPGDREGLGPTLTMQHVCMAL